MTYITQQDLVERGWERALIQLTDKVNRPATTIDTTIVDRHISDAASLIDTYLSKTYALPLVDVPPALTKVAADLAIYYLHGQSVEKDSPVDRAYRDALRWLDQVARGLVALQADGIEPPAAGDGRVQYSGPDRIFSRQSLRDL